VEWSEQNHAQGGISGCGQQIVVAAPAATLTASTGIGAALVEGGVVTFRQPLRTSIGTLTAQADGVGIFIENEGPLTVASAIARHAFPYGIIDIAATGTITVGILDGTSILLTPLATDGSEGEALRWHNFKNPLDVNDDGYVSSLDVLKIVNRLNAFGDQTLAEGELVGGAARQYVDVNGDGLVTPRDALQVINHLNREGGAEGEGQATPPVDLFFQSAADRDPTPPPVAPRDVAWPLAIPEWQPLVRPDLTGVPRRHPEDELDETLEKLLGAIAGDVLRGWTRGDR